MTFSLATGGLRRMLMIGVVLILGTALVGLYGMSREGATQEGLIFAGVMGLVLVLLLGLARLAGQGRVEVSGLGVKIEMGPLVQAFIPLENIEKAEVIGRRVRGLGVHTDFIGSLDIITSGGPVVELVLKRRQKARMLFLPARLKRARLSLEDGQAFLSFLDSFLGKRS